MLIIASFVSTSLNVWANNIEEIREQRDELNVQIDAGTRELHNTRAEIRSVTAELAELEYQLSLLVDLLEAITFDLNLTRGELRVAETELSQAMDERDIHLEAFTSRVRHIYMNGWMGYIDAILGAQSLMDLFNRIDHVNRMVSFDRNLVEELKRVEENISSLVDEIRTREDDLLQLEGYQIIQMLEYDELLEQKVALRTALEETEEGQALALEQLEDDRRELDRIIQEDEDRRAREAARQAEIDRQNNVVQRSFVHDNQALQWPLPGFTRISSPFGNRPDPFHGRTVFHSGVDVPAPMGINILAAESGTVIFSSWQGGYGNTVIINHGNGIHTMYAHASSLVVRVGQNVNRGDVIARVGSTGRSTGNHLHFEVRVNGSLVNPLNFTSPN